MKKTFEKVGLLALTGMLVIGQASATFASTKTPGSGKSELSTYNAELATQRTKLSELIAKSKELSSEITAEQKAVKEKGYITKSSSEELAKLSGEIKAKRQELTVERGQNKTLRAAAKEARTSGDVEEAKDQLILLEAVQEKQIKIRTELVELLEKKLSYLKSMTGTSTSTDEVVVEIQTEGDSTQAQTTESAVTVETTVTETVTEGTTEAIAESAAVTETVAETVAETAAAEELITDQAAIDAVFDDGAELEDSDF